MSIIFDHDPVTGVTTHWDYDPITDKIHLTYEQDVSKILDQIKEKRLTSKSFGHVEEFAHYATIPTIVQMEMLKKGLDLADKNATKGIIREIETNYPLLKTTSKKHSAK